MATATRSNQHLIGWSESSSFSPIGVSIAVLCFNLLDGLLTLLFLQLNLAEEANPLMRFVYRGSPMGFLLVKLTVVQLALLVLCLNSRVRLARYALVSGAILYAAIVAYHLAFLARLALG